MNLNREKLKNFIELVGMDEEPLGFLYADEKPEGAAEPPENAHQCIFVPIAKARKGKVACISKDAFGCHGGGYYLGFIDGPRDGIEYFLSHGKENVMPGERYKKTPELAKKYFEEFKAPTAGGKFGLFEGMGAMLDRGDEPSVAIFFVKPDALAGLFTLANYGRAEDAVISHFSAACGGLVTEPLRQASAKEPKACISGFDVSARPYIPEDELTFAMPVKMLEEMVGNAEESFLGLDSWKKVKRRLKK